MSTAPVRPIIGITQNADGDIGGPPSDTYAAYADAVARAGAQPLALPYRSDLSTIPALLDQVHGVLLSGGDDLNPSLYGQTRHPHAIPLDPRRQRFELAVAAEAERRRLPMLGICLGSQVMNVHRGGSLFQFLPDLPRQGALEHRSDRQNPRRHPVSLLADSILARAIGRTDISANTYHKQAVCRLGRGLRVVARSPDGIIEATEDDSLPLFVGVQWHPERLRDEPEHLAIFKLLVDKATRRSP